VKAKGEKQVFFKLFVRLVVAVDKKRGGNKHIQPNSTQLLMLMPFVL